MKLALGLLLTLSLVACGGADKPESKQTPAPATATPSETAAADDTEELRSAAQAYSDAFLTGDADESYAALSARCQGRISSADWASVVDQAKTTYGEALPFKSFEVQVSGDLARVTYTYAVAEINQDSEPWVREDGAWHEDDC